MSRAYLVETRYECLRMLRAPGFAIPFLGLPVLLYLLFAVVIFGAAARGNVNAGKFFFCGFSMMGVVGPGMFGFGVMLALEREQGYLRLKRALPGPPAAPLVARLLMAMSFSALVMASMLVAAATLGGLALSPAQALAVSAVGILGAVPFAGLGLILGAVVSGRAAPAVVNLVYLPMLYLSGLFFPLPASLLAAAPIWPAYHLHQLALRAVGAPSRGEPALHVAVLVIEAALFTLLAVRRLERTR